MERYENIIKIEEIRRLIDGDRYNKAVKILDTMDVNKIKALPDLSIIADVFIQNERYDEAMSVLLKIYNKTKTRRVLYQLVDLSIRQGNADEAEEYLKKYIKAAPSDPYRFVFRYCIDKINEEPYDILIDSLEQLKEYEYIEVWAYELAKLYHKAGMTDKCVRECSDIILWFGDGVYVEKAKLLKAFYVGDLNPAHILKTKVQKEVTERLGLEKTKDYSNIRSQIDEFLAGEEAKKEAAKEVENDLEELPQVTFDNLLNENQEVTNQKDDQYQLEAFEALEDELIVRMIQPDEEKQVLESESLEQVNNSQDDSYNEDIQMLLNMLTSEESQETTGTLPQISTEDNQTMIETDNKEINQEIASSDDEIIEEQTTVHNNQEIETETGSDYDTQTDFEIETELADTTEIKSGITQADTIFTLLTNSGFDINKEFGSFVKIDRLKQQMQLCLENILTDYTNINHLVIAGESKSGKTTLSKKICKGLFFLNWIKSDRIAKINAEKLNQINLNNQAAKLMNSSLIIEEAGKLTSSSVNNLMRFLEVMKENIFIILEDNERDIKKLMDHNLELMKYFQNQINLPEYTTEDIYFFAVHYIEEKDYRLENEIRLQFKIKVYEIAELTGLEERLEAVMDFAKKTVEAADNRYKSKLADILNAPKLGFDDLLYIAREDFL